MPPPRRRTRRRPQGGKGGSRRGSGGAAARRAAARRQKRRNDALRADIRDQARANQYRTKSYPENFAGIIAAIQDLRLGQEQAPVFPDVKPKLNTTRS